MYSRCTSRRRSASRQQQLKPVEKLAGLREGSDATETLGQERTLALCDPPLARGKRGTLFYNRKFANCQCCEIKSARPRSESSSSSAPHVLEWNSFSSLLPLSLMFRFLLGFSAFPFALLFQDVELTPCFIFFLFFFFPVI